MYVGPGAVHPKPAGLLNTLNGVPLYAVPGAVHSKPAPNIAQNVDHSASTGSLDSSGDENRSLFRELRLAGDLTVLVSQLFGNDATSPKACSDKFRRVPPAPLSATPRLKSLEVWIRAPEPKHLVHGSPEKPNDTHPCILLRRKGQLDWETGRGEQLARRHWIVARKRSSPNQYRTMIQTFFVWKKRSSQALYIWNYRL